MYRIFMEIIELDAGMQKKYLKGIAAIHCKAYSDNHFTSCFSIEKTMEYYSWLIKAGDLSLVALEDDEVMGFIISGIAVSKGVDAFVARNRPYLARLLLSHPRFLYQKAMMSLCNAILPSEPSAARFRLLSIAVDPACQSCRVGTEMLGFLEGVLGERCVPLYGLSVRGTNHNAVKFYERRGFVLERESRVSKYYLKEIG